MKREAPADQLLSPGRANGAQGAPSRTGVPRGDPPQDTDRGTGADPLGLRLHRDEVTHAGYAALAAWAWFLYGFGSLLPLLRAEQDVSRTVMGLHSLALSAGALVAGEFCTTAWSADLLRQQIGVSAGAASAGVTAIVAGMAAGRVVAGRLALRTQTRHLLFAALAVTALGWLVTWLATVPVAAIAGLTLTGLGIAGHYPLGVALVLGSVPGQGDRATGVLSLGIGFSAGLAPFAIGTLADATSTQRRS